MSSAASTSATRTTLAFRVLALGSSAAAAIHLSPIVIHSTAPQSVTLCGCEEPFLIRAGLSRVARQARSGSAGRCALLDAGVLAALQHCVRSKHANVRKEAHGALILLMREDQAVKEVMANDTLRESLVRLQGEQAVSAWKRVVEVDAGRMHIRRYGVCERQLEDNVRCVLNEAGACTARLPAVGDHS